MNTEKPVDAFGERLWAYYKELTDQPEIVERDDNFIRVGKYGQDMYFAPFEQWEDIEQKAMAYAKGKVLDVGCGAGRHALYLQEKGFDVLGIDSSPLAVEVCQDRGVKNVRELAFEDVDPLQDQKFDTILMLGHNFGLFGNAEKAKVLLGKLSAITSYDAIIIAETRDPYVTEDPSHLAYQEQNRKKGLMSGQIRIRIRYSNLIGPWFEYLFVSKKEMEKILEGTGWKILQFITAPENPSYVAVIIKIRA